jgi:hypothetical protein
MAISIMLAAALAAQAPAQPAASFDWLIGEWACQEASSAGGPVYRSEAWRPDGADGLIGEIRTTHVRGGVPDRRTIATLRITGQGNGIRMAYVPANGPAIIFRSVRQASREVVFESASPGQPQRIAYRRGTFGRPGARPALGPRNLAVAESQLDGSRARSWTMSDVRMHVGRFCRSPR